MKHRIKRLSVRLTTKEKDYLDKQAQTAGIKLEPYVRALIAGHEVKERPSEVWAEIVRQLSAIGNNINQIARVANSTGVIKAQEISAITNLQSEIWKKVKDL